MAVHLGFISQAPRGEGLRASPYESGFRAEGLRFRILGV